ncbi:cytochrome P450 [Infundibulicybe gibba]|nr:cytochrome P450 [Infundibulicybe gibba]
MAWVTYTKWAETYGSCNIIHAEAFGQHIVVLNSLEDATEIMEKRASNYSSRPPLPMLDLMGCIDYNVGLLPRGDLWRRHRRVFQKGFRKDAVVLYEPIETSKHIRTVTGAIITAIVYGYNISSMDDKFVLIAEEATSLGARAMPPSVWFVNTFPMLRHIPPWFPGAKFHQVAGKVRKLVYQMQNMGFDFVRDNMRDGTGKPSLLRDLLEAVMRTVLRLSTRPFSRASPRRHMGVPGADTTVSAVMTFFYAMVTNPDAHGRRRTKLTVSLVVPPTSAWGSIIVALCGSIDDVYKGFFIPKGSVVFPNVWAMTRNEDVYKDPDSFHPGRYFDDQGKLNGDDTILTFGFGERVCVGRHLASSTIWLIIASVLATLNIAKAKDSRGNEIEIEGRYTGGAISHPSPFPCSVTPRSLKSRELIESDG